MINESDMARQYTENAVQLSAMAGAGQGNTPRAIRLREGMDDLYEKLTAEERERLKAYSALHRHG